MFSVPFLSTVNPIYNKASFDFKQEPVSGKKQSDGITSLTENPSVINADLLRQKIIKKRLSLLKPIKSEKDFKKVFENIITFLLYSFDNECENEDKIQLKTVEKFFGLEPINISDSEYLDFDGYEDIDFNLKGLVAYCGSADISRQINCWLTARKDSNPPQITDDQMADIIRAFEYSLRQLDKKYGKIKGMVYRAGYFNPITDKQYYSASDYISCALDHSYRKEPSKGVPYSIIRIKNGHDIYDFQKDTATEVSSVFALREREILIDRKSTFRLVPKKEYTKQEHEDIRNIIYQTIDCDIKDLPPKRKAEITKNISVWEEI